MSDQLQNHAIEELIRKLNLIIEETEYPGEKFNSDGDPLPIDDEATYSTLRKQKINSWKEIAKSEIEGMFSEDISTEFSELLSTSDDNVEYEQYLHDLLT
jgi:hypothetical protein